MDDNNSKKRPMNYVYEENKKQKMINKDVKNQMSMECVKYNDRINKMHIEYNDRMDKMQIRYQNAILQEEMNRKQRINEDKQRMREGLLPIVIENIIEMRNKEKFFMCKKYFE